MHRIDTKTAQKDKFGAGKNGFTRGNPQTGTPATDLDDDYFDMLQEELCSVVEASGASLEKARHDQLLTALRALLLSRKNPFGDIKSDGTVQTALENLGFGERLLEADGYFELPGGLLLQWGHGSVQATNATVRFKKPFNVTPFIVLPHKITTDGRYVTSVNYTQTGFSLYGWSGNGTANNIDSYTYLALGI
ncbi:gp53-like domain-containing protein [Escherichia coli]|uniref:gp53-like domain-containing protein n=1 Tax=Escherichia coli TaxID=562 RepID=UPI003D81786C